GLALVLAGNPTRTLSAVAELPLLADDAGVAGTAAAAAARIQVAYGIPAARHGLALVPAAPADPVAFLVHASLPRLAPRAGLRSAVARPVLRVAVGVLRAVPALARIAHADAGDAVLVIRADLAAAPAAAVRRLTGLPRGAGLARARIGDPAAILDED